MKKSNKKEINNLPHPRCNPDFAGHEKATELLTRIISTDRVPQSWLITGQKGVGKATLAYRFARAILAGSKDLYIPKTHPTFSRVAGASHSDLITIEPDPEKASGDIAVDQIRKINDFLRLTASETQHRIVIIDSADDMNTNAANALLKLLEEPPSKAMFILISHAPGKLLPTIKSRCRTLNLGALTQFQSSSILQTAIPDISPFEADKYTYLAGGSPGIAIDLYYNNGMEIYEKLIAALDTIPHINYTKVQSLADAVAKKGDKAAWNIMAYLLDTVLIRIIKSDISENYSSKINNEERGVKSKLLVEKTVEDCLNIWEKSNSLISDTSRIHLDKNAVITTIFREFAR